MMLSVFMDKEAADDMNHYITQRSLHNEFPSSGSIKNCVFLII